MKILSQQKKEFKSTKEYKTHKALMTGAAIASAALATYGTYRAAKYIADQKDIMFTKDQIDVLSRLIPQYEANATLLKEGKQSISFFEGSSDNAKERAINKYLETAQKYTDEVKSLNGKISDISKKHLYNFGLKMTIDEYNRKKDVVTKAAKLAGQGAVKTGKKIVDYSLELFPELLSALLT